MDIFFVLLSFVALIVLAVGLVRPSIVKLSSRRKVGMCYGGAFVLLLIIGIAITPTDTSLPVATTPSPAPAQAQSTTKPAVAPTPTPVADNSASKVQAQKDLDDLMALSEKANLVHSYDFSDTARVIYIDSVWYTQDVQFKKDFLAKVDTILIRLYGNKNPWEWFQVKDAYSNEKVAEVTAFSGSLEVYK
jgi:hypothetical protein